MIVSRCFSVVLTLFFFVEGGFGHSGEHASKELEKKKKAIAIKERLGNTLPLNLRFSDEYANLVPIKNYFKGDMPVIVTPVYYTCPHLCTYIFQGLTDAINQEKKWVLGKDYRILSVSIDHEDTPAHARLRKEEFMKKMEIYTNGKYKKQTESGWSLLTGKRKDIKKFYDAIGFRYKKEGEEYAHTASLVFVTPKAKVARYLYGISYQKNDFRLALLESSQEKISSFMDQVFFYCFRYDPEKRVYSLIAWRVMTIGGVLTALFIMILLSVLWLKERSKEDGAKTT